MHRSPIVVRILAAVRALASRRDVVSDESGQILIFGVVLLTVMLVVGAVVMDAGMAFSEKDGVQTATDAAALAGARKLPDQSAAKTAACDYLARNGYSNTCILITSGTGPCPSGSNCVDIPPTQGQHAGNVSYIEVIGQSSSAAGFINIFAAVGVLKPSARSVVGMISGGPGYGVFASGGTCPPVNNGWSFWDANGGQLNIYGDVQTNGAAYITSNVHVSGNFTYTCPIQGGGINGTDSFGNPDGNPDQVPAQPLPTPCQQPAPAHQCTASDFPCNYNLQTGIIDGGHLARDQNNVAHYHPPLTNTNINGTLDPGVYCFNGRISIPSRIEDLNGGGVTFVAKGATGTIEGAGGCGDGAGAECTHLLAYSQHVLFYAESNSATALRPGGATTGFVNYGAPGNGALIIAPNGTIDPAGHHINFYGGLMSKVFHFTIQGAGCADCQVNIYANGSLGGGGVTTSLVE